MQQQITKEQAIEKIKGMYRAKDSKIYVSSILLAGVAEIKTANGAIEQNFRYSQYWLGMIDDKIAKQQSEEAFIYSNYRLVFIDSEGRDYLVNAIDAPIVEPKLEEIL